MYRNLGILGSLWSRSLSTAAHSGRAGGLIEMREYVLYPSGIKDFMKFTSDYLELRMQLLPFLGMFACDTGGVLNRVIHLYHYNSMEERESVRAAVASNKEWNEDYLLHCRHTVQTQYSAIYLPTTQILDTVGIPALVDILPQLSMQREKPSMYELRHYQLNAGYGGVPSFSKSFVKGLPGKLAADKEGQLLFIGHTDVGVLNNVIELWRYPGGAGACIKGRQASRTVQLWREAIEEIAPGVQTFTTSFLTPVPFSPMK